MRVGEGSVEAALPKKFSSSMAGSEVWESVEPTMPNLQGLVPSFASNCSPIFRAERAYSYFSISSVLASVRSRLPASHVS